MFFLILYALLTLANSTCVDHIPDRRRTENAMKCLPVFQKNPSVFSVCKNEPCLLFTKQDPFVIIPEPIENSTSSSSGEYQRLFNCSNPKELFPFTPNRRFTGVVFDIFRDITTPVEPKCAWAGPTKECTFNSLIDFVYLMGTKGYESELYQFGVANFLVEIPLRRCLHHYGTPIGDDIISIASWVGNERSLSSLVTRLLSPFDWKTWILFIGFFVAIMIVAAIAVCSASPNGKFSAIRTVLLIWGYVNVITNNSRKKSKFSLTIISLGIHASIIGLLGTMILYYEIGLVANIFTASKSTGIYLKLQTEDELKQFCVNGESAAEKVLKLNGESKFHVIT